MIYFYINNNLIIICRYRYCKWTCKLSRSKAYRYTVQSVPTWVLQFSVPKHRRLHRCIKWQLESELNIELVPVNLKKKTIIIKNRTAFITLVDILSSHRSFRSRSTINVFRASTSFSKPIDWRLRSVTCAFAMSSF